MLLRCSEVLGSAAPFVGWTEQLRREREQAAIFPGRDVPAEEQPVAAATCDVRERLLNLTLLIAAEAKGADHVSGRLADDAACADLEAADVQGPVLRRCVVDEMSVLLVLVVICRVKPLLDG